MAEEKGYDNLKIALDLIIEVSNVVDAVIHDKDFGVRIAHVSKLIDEVASLANFDLSELKLEYANLSAAEREALVSHLRTKFDLRNDELEFKIEEASTIAIEIATLIPKAIDLVRGFKDVVKVSKRTKKTTKTTTEETAE